MRSLGLETGPVLPGDLRFEGGLAAGLSIAKLSPRPTAVMAINDLTAVGVIKGLRKSGIRVPQDISVTGFDNTRLAEYSNPSIKQVPGKSSVVVLSPGISSPGCLGGLPLTFVRA